MTTETQTQKPVRINKQAKHLLVQLFNTPRTDEECSEWTKVPVEKVARFRAECEAARAEFEASPERQEQRRRHSLSEVCAAAVSFDVTDDEFAEQVATHTDQWGEAEDFATNLWNVRNQFKVDQAAWEAERRAALR